jgi:hypothetical protein
LKPGVAAFLRRLQHRLIILSRGCKITSAYTTRHIREEHEEEEVPANAGPSEFPKTFHSLLGRPNPHQIRVGKREKTHRAIERIKMTGWIINILILLV